MGQFRLEGSKLENSLGKIRWGKFAGENSLGKIRWGKFTGVSISILFWRLRVTAG